MNNDPFAALFADPQTAFGCAQGVLRRTLDAFGIILEVNGNKWFYHYEGVIIAECSETTLFWRNGSNKQISKVIEAHASLFTP